MNTCRFCQRKDFSTPQSVYAHLKWCADYLKLKQKRNAALGTSLRQAVPKAPPQQATPSLTLPFALPQLNDPFAPFMEFLQSLGVSPPQAGGTQETAQQRRRRLLQDAKVRAIDHYFLAIGTVTSEMKAAAKLAIDRELRNEPLEELTPQEVIQLAEGVRDRIYTVSLRQNEKQARRAQEEKERKRADERGDDRKQKDRAKKKSAFLDEARRRVVATMTTRSLSPLKRLLVMEEVLSLLDQTLTGDEPLSEAYAALDAILDARLAELDAHEAAQEAKQHREWKELATVVAVVIALWIMCVKYPEILQWLLKHFSPEPTEGSDSASKPTSEAPSKPTNEETPRRPIRRMRRPPQAPPPKPPSAPSERDSEYPLL